MSKQAPRFLTYEQAIEVVKKEPDVEFIGLRFEAPHRSLGVYSVYVYSDELDYVNIGYEGGLLFSSCGEEESYGEADVPEEAKTLIYAREQDLGSRAVRGMMSEYVLAEVLPGLKDPDDYPSRPDFVRAAVQAYESFWRTA